MYSLTEENYLKAILHLTTGKKPVNTNRIAEEMDTKASSVTDMVKRLSDKKLVYYQPYHGSLLTEKGKEVALNVIRKHRLWEVFLVEKLNFNWDEVHDIAEQLEHIQSHELIKRLDDFLGNPKWDPHGDPIPDENGLIQTSKEIKLDEMEINQSGVITGVNDSSPAFLQYLDGLNIHLGSQLTVLKRFEYDKSMQIEVNNEAIMISHQVAQNINIHEN